MRVLRKKASAAPAADPRRVILLGPQTHDPTLGDTVHDLEDVGLVEKGGSLAAITAGWQDREGEPHLLDARVEHRVVDLELYRRAEELADADPELVAGHKAVQNRLKTLRRAYNVRLAALVSAEREVRALEGDADVLGEEEEAAVEAMRDLDRRHLGRVAELRATYEETFRPSERDAVARHREALRETLDGVDTVVIAGGHVATLLNRLRLFGVKGLMGDRAIVAWSAGAMALAERVALFHDRPPWGEGNAEVFDLGLGFVSDIVAFPHATARLELADEARTSRLARRLAPDACLLLDPGARVEWSGGVWTAAAAERLAPAGGRVPFAPRAA